MREKQEILRTVGTVVISERFGKQGNFFKMSQIAKLARMCMSVPSRNVFVDFKCLSD